MTPQAQQESWATNWPTESGWYWSWIEGVTDHKTNKPDMRPVHVIVAGTEPRTFLIYLRDGQFFYKAEQTITVWWLPLDMPEFKKTP